MIESFNNSITIFRSLNNNQVKKIENISRIYNCKNGDIIFLQGEYCNSLIIVYSGSFLIRKRENDKIIDERIIHQGDIFDFKEIVTNSITSYSLEAIERSSLLSVDIIGLKRLGKKDPVLLSLIKEEMWEDNKKIWDDCFLKSTIKSKNRVLKINRSMRNALKNSFIYFLIIFFIANITTILFQKSNIVMANFIAGSLFFLIVFFNYLKYKLEFLEFNSEYAILKQITLRKISTTNKSIPIENIISTKILYRNRIDNILNLGEIVIESGGDKISLSGVYNPGSAIDKLNSFRERISSLNKAISITSFRYLFNKKQNLFNMENYLEQNSSQAFVFRKSLFLFFLKTVPFLLIFLLSSLILCYLFNSYIFLTVNIPIVFFAYWFYVDWNNDIYSFEGGKILDIEKKPFWGKEIRIESDITLIQSVKKIQRNMLEIILNYGDIELKTQNDTIIYPFISNPDSVIENLYLIKKYYYTKKESIERLKRQEEFVDYTKYYQELNRK